MIRLYGIETEYGSTREDQDAVDPVVESHNSLDVKGETWGVVQI